MATYVKFLDFVNQLARGTHQLHAAGHTCNVYLTNTAPNTATHTAKGDLAGITEQNGYAAADAQNDISTSAGTASVTGVDIEWTATSTGFGPFRYVVLYNDTPTSPIDPLIAYWDYGSTVSCASGEKFKVDFGSEIFKLS